MTRQYTIETLKPDDTRQLNDLFEYQGITIKIVKTMLCQVAVFASDEYADTEIWRSRRLANNTRRKELVKDVLRWMQLNGLTDTTLISVWREQSPWWDGRPDVIEWVRE